MKIFKYEIITNTHKHATVISIPKNSRLIHIENQWKGDSNVYAWFEIPKNGSNVLMNNRTFLCMFTGHEFNPKGLTHITSKVITDSFVVHIYEKDSPEIPKPKPFLSDKDFVL